MLSEADLVWNRACFRQADELSARGDRALAALLSFHNLAMNGGVLHPFECLEPRELAAARSGYRFFGYPDVAELILEIGSAPVTDGLPDFPEELSEQRYGTSISDDELPGRFEKYFAEHPSDFAPLSDADRSDPLIAGC